MVVNATEVMVSKPQDAAIGNNHPGDNIRRKHASARAALIDSRLAKIVRTTAATSAQAPSHPAHDWLAPPPSGHRIREGHRVVANPVLGGLHHEYRLESLGRMTDFR